MRKLGLFDGALQMFVEEAREPDMRWLEFVRWLVEHGRLEPDVVGLSPGLCPPSIGEPTVYVPDLARDGGLVALGDRGLESFGGTVE